MKEQKRLFEIVKSKISGQYRLADIIEDLLGVSSDSAYRRIRGEKELSFSELKKICEKFNLSMDEILNYNSNQGALFHYIPVNLENQESYIARFRFYQSSRNKIEGLINKIELS
ncbi:MAG: helix-turn-helix domain-containing protein [Bacteroidales bacterium]|jgi:DNA-binding Xre family transcriptional regulator|nr:helix-turn-helix domain-containing protein [Bacteroidales bacterium]